MSNVIQIDLQKSTNKLSHQTLQKKYTELYGEVVYVNNKNRKSVIFNVMTEDKKKYRCTLDGFFPVKEGDVLYGVGEHYKDPRWKDSMIFSPENTPLVLLGSNESIILKNFLTALRGSGFGNEKAYNLWDRLVEKYGNTDKAIAGLDELSCLYNWKKETNGVHLEPYRIIVSKNQMLKLLKWWYKNRVLRRLYLFGINNKEIRTLKISPIEIYQKCLTNPYLLFDLPLNKCDSIYIKTGHKMDPKTRKCGEICRSINDKMTNSGWSGVPSYYILKKYPNITDYMDVLKNVFEVKGELRTIYLPYAHQVETGMVELIQHLVENTHIYTVEESLINYTRPDLSEDQKMAIKNALDNNLHIITGGGGSGKTTVIKELVHICKSNGIRVQVASFTGKAVARIREVTEETEPMTLHMMLNSYKTIEFDHLIIDEASMVTSSLMYEILQKYPNDYKITLIGDVNQLTPIGWGTLFNEMIKSGTVPISRLTKIHRTQNFAENGILINSYNIIEQMDPDYNGPPFEFEETENFKVFEGDISTVKKLIEILQNSGINSDNLVTICPYNQYINEINVLCKDLYNGTNRHVIDSNGTKFHINDRVMMTENNYHINVMNGDEGTVVDLTNDEVQVKFKSGEFVFKTDCDNSEDFFDSSGEKELSTSSLVHSFAVTVHRYQGSEKDFVVIFVPDKTYNGQLNSSFLNRNLMYTAITRAKKMIWLVGSVKTMKLAASTPPPYRCDNLAARLNNQ